VRVGPYNVNPESAIEKASVISHEYGHSLGLPDYYSTGSRSTYGSWTLMASDYSQNIDIVGKKELGWVVPRVLGANRTVDAAGWEDTKVDVNRIDWKQPDGTPYSLTGPDVRNGEAYTAPLPRRRIIDPALVPSGDKLQWSGSGNDFGCPPNGGHNIDIAPPALADVPAGTPVTLTFKSRWDIERDYDYGFVLSSTDNGKSYQSHASEKGYTTPGSQNTNANGCQAYGNGLTGSSGSYDAGTQTVDRLASSYPDAPFVDDAYDLSELAGKASVLRLTYSTDPGLARAGWFVDDLEVRAGDRVIYSSDFESATDTAIYNGGCREDLQTAQQCTHGWQQISAADGSPAEHAYLLEMRDRSGFDAHGRGESDRGDLTFAPACCSPTPTRTTATATSAPTTRRRRARSTPSPSPRTRTRTWTTPRSPRRAATRRSRTPAAGMSTITPTHRVRTACGASPSTASRSRSGGWPARTSARPRTSTAT